MRYSFNSQRGDITTGWNLDSADAWDSTTSRVKPEYCGAHGEKSAEINTDLDRKREQLVLSFSYFEALDLFPTPADILMKYEDRIKGITPKRPKPEVQKNEKAEKDFYKVFQEFLDECGEKNAWTEATFEKMSALKEDLLVFKPKIKFSDLTESTLTKFVAYLRDDKKLRTPRKKKGERDKYDNEDIIGLKNSTIEKKLGYFRWFLNWATDKGYNKNIAYKTFRPTLKRTQKKVIFLTKEEMKSIRDFVLPSGKEYLEPVRDVFLFCCFSGLRHSDAVNLRRIDLKASGIEVTTVKTADSLYIEYNDVNKAILDKYKEYPTEGGRALPALSNQAMNRDLKELCKLAGINEEIRITTYKGNTRIDEIKKKYELVGTHTGRRTFIVSALSRGVPPNVVMKWTGHSDYKSMKPYIDIVDSIKASEMSKMNFLD